MRVLHLDFETCNSADLRRVGADVYSRDPSLIVTVLAWAWDDQPVQSEILPKALPLEISTRLRGGAILKAWNAAFEWAILRNHYGLDLQPEQAICTMQAALHSGLPAALADAGPAIGASVSKDPTARRLMLQMAKPRIYGGYWHEREPDKLEALRVYCERDVKSEREISRLIAPLPPQEARVAALDRAANERGIHIDLDLVHELQRLAKEEIGELNARCVELTNGAVTDPGSQVSKLLRWLKSKKVYDPTLVEIENLGREAVIRALDELAEKASGRWGPTVQEVLTIRSEVAKSSLKKLDAMERCIRPDGTVGGQLAYYGAFRTGRWAGRLIQPQNFPRPSVKDVGSFIRHALTQADRGWVRSTWGPPLEAVASSLRGCFIPRPGRAFVVYDLSQIEARVVAWLAGQTDVLEVFARGEDVYAFTQKRLGLASRQAGKVVVLACGFGMGPDRFQVTAAKSGLDVSLAQAANMVTDWREANSKIVRFWGDLDRAAKQVLARKGASIVNDRISLASSQSLTGRPLMTLRLPSGRRLYYRSARLEKDEKGRDAIVYDGVHQLTKRWSPIRTYGAKLAENATQATARDVIVEAAMRIDALRLGELVLSVHDELVFEVPLEEAEARAAAIGTEIDRRPDWAQDLPVASEGAWALRYGK